MDYTVLIRKCGKTVSESPLLVPIGVSKNENVAIHDAVGKVFGRPTFYHLKIANRPTGTHVRPTARKVAGRIQICDLAGKAKGEERLTRWKHSPGPLEAGKSADLQQAEDLHPSGIEYYLDIAMKYDEDDEFYTPNNDTALTHPDFRDPKIAFGKGHYVARIELAGENVKTTISCRIHNPGKGKPLTLELVMP